MSAPTRLRGNQNFYLTLALSEATAVNFSDDVSAYEMSFTDKDGDDLTFNEAASGLGQIAELKLTALISLDTSSLWQFADTNPGVEVEVVLAPFGNATPSSTQPHREFTATMPGRPTLSNEATLAAKAKGQTYDIVLTGATDPVWVTA